MSVFARLPSVPNDRAERAALLAQQERRLAEVISITPVVARLAAAVERSEAVDHYADRIAQAYGKK